MGSECYNEQDDVTASNQVCALSSGSGPWLSGLVTQSTFENSLDRNKFSSMENCGEQFMPIAPKPTQLNLFSGDSKDTPNGQKPVQFQAAFVMQPATQTYGGHLELGFGQPDVICGKYPYGDQYFGVVSIYGPQIAGRVMLPLNLSTDDMPIYVNAKQYNGIIRRRQTRAKAEMAKKVAKSRKPFLHLSRHLHAKRRPRGCGGRFLNAKEMEMCKIQNLDSKLTKVLQSDHETNGSRSHMSGSEVTSMFSDMMMSGKSFHDFGMNNKWVVAAGGGGTHCHVAI
ncbi:nuclear transcription factor Y subunit A-10-like [Rutidosis leptorrhynchoides]|uniref:nuclear transcription factor Y subunit A-10-like n=1 Tax=Rutidosis leptorrhynchoides TaxID=125765 RepID=UPI003A9945CF